MKNFNLTVENSSNYWSSYEGEMSAYYYIRWKEEENINKFFCNEDKFIDNYALLTYKYGIALPINYTKKYLMHDFYKFKIKEEKRGIKNLNPFSYLYSFKDTFHNIYPSALFVNMHDIPKLVTNIDPYNLFSEFMNFDPNNCTSYQSPPFRIEFIKNENELAIISYIDNDIFNETIDNNKTKRDPEVGGKGYWIDNSDLAYLNSTRLNSFIRDLKKLCFDFYATDFEFENSGLEYFTENGVSLGKEIIFYEDIYDLLPEKHKYRVTSFETYNKNKTWKGFMPD